MKIHGAKSPQESVNLERTLSMQQREFLTRARKALIKHGIIGSRAKALLEEWNDHLQSEVEKLVAGGKDRESSYQDACKALGEPESALIPRPNNWRWNHGKDATQILSSGILSVVVFLLGIFGMVAGGTLLKTNFEYLSSEMLKHLVTLVGTLPWLLCLGKACLSCPENASRVERIMVCRHFYGHNTRLSWFCLRLY